MAEARRGEVSQCSAGQASAALFPIKGLGRAAAAPSGRGEGLSQPNSGKWRRLWDFPICTLEICMSRAEPPPMASGQAEASVPA